MSVVEIDWRGRPVRIEVAWVGATSPEAPLLVFLHEGLGSVALWKDFPQRLCEAAGAAGLVWSRPGYGRSTPRAPHERWGRDFMHRQATEVMPVLLQALGVDGRRRAVWLFGHSDGGTIALLHAAAAGPGPEPAAPGLGPIAGSIVLAPHIDVEQKAQDAIAVARRAYLEGDLRSRLARYHDDPDSAFWGWHDAWLAPAFQGWQIHDELRMIRTPLLAIQGEHDDYGTMEQIRGIRRRVPHAQLLELADCGHAPHADRPERLIEAAVDFIKNHPDGD